MYMLINQTHYSTKVVMYIIVRILCTIWMGPRRHAVLNRLLAAVDR